MFTGIIKGVGKIEQIDEKPGLLRIRISADIQFLSNLEIGASISIDGTCLTVVTFTPDEVEFDVINETLERTTLKFLKSGDQVNMERAARFGDEIGGHVLSGHIYGTVAIDEIEQTPNNYILSFKCPAEWTKYLIPKGYVALNGASLTLVDVDKKQGVFTVHLIPETLQKTTFGTKKVNDLVNLELDSQTQTIVDTIEAQFSSLNP
jgi:riboflavin synthase